MKESVLELLEDNDALVEVTVKNEDKTPFDLTGYAPINFYIKASPDASDGTPVYTLAGGTITIVDAAAGRLNIQMTAADLADPDSSWFRLDGYKAGRKLTLGYGLLRIKDV